MKKRLKELLQTNALTPILIETEIGFGALSATKATAEELGLKTIEVRLSLMEWDDTKPFHDLKITEPTVVILTEFNRATMAVQFEFKTIILKNRNPNLKMVIIKSDPDSQYSAGNGFLPNCINLDGTYLGMRKEEIKDKMKKEFGNKI